MMPEHARKLSSLVLGVALVATLTPAGFAQDKSEKAEAKADTQRDATKPPASGGKAAESKAGEEEVLVFTNEDLKRLFGEEEPGTPPAEPGQAPAAGRSDPPPLRPGEPAAQPPTDPLTWMADRKARAEERQKRIAEAEKAVADGEARVSELEKRMLAVKNPYLARPEISDEEKEGWDEMDAVERVKRTEDDLAQARKDLVQARQELRQLRATP
jgi:hypothetical protein